MSTAADLYLVADDAPPESGVRVAAEAPRAIAPAPALPPDAQVLGEVTAEVFLDVWGVVRALAPLQGAWLTLGWGPLGAAALKVARWRLGGRADASPRALRERWPELVPGFDAMDRLAGLMVDRLCD